jgi:virginiamycin B lyase
VGGGNAVSINGANFTEFGGALTVRFGGVAAGFTQVLSNTFISALAPAHDIGTVDVTVTTAGGTSATSATTKYEFWNITFYPIPTDHIFGTLVPVGDELWFGERAKGKLGRVAMDGGVTEIPLPHTDADPSDLALGPDSNLWYADHENNLVARVTTAVPPVITEFPLGNPFGIAAGPGTTVWYTMSLCPGTLDQQQRIGIIDTAHTASRTDFDVPGSTLPFGIAMAPDHDVYFAEFVAQKIGHTTTGATIAASAALSGTPSWIIAGPDGQLWFTDGKLGSIDPATGTVVEHTTITPPAGRTRTWPSTTKPG